MPASAKVLLDSVCYEPYAQKTKIWGHRLTTIEARYQRFVHSELLTHRALSRNSGSSRAIPIEKMLQQVVDDPAMPVYWGSNKSGMQAGEELTGLALQDAYAEWLRSRDDAVTHAWRLHNAGLHKQLVNRVVEPWMWITVIVTATDWANFFTQRCHPDAQPEIRYVAELIRDAYNASVPKVLAQGAWHMPLILPEDREVFADKDLRKISVARCARVSYLTHDKRHDPQKDLELYERLLNGGANGHWSPFEHVATPDLDDEYLGQLTGNFTGWRQFRKLFRQENVQQPSYRFEGTPEIDLSDDATP